MRGVTRTVLSLIFPLNFSVFSEKVKLVRREERGVRAGCDSHGASPHFSAKLFFVLVGISRRKLN